MVYIKNKDFLLAFREGVLFHAGSICERAWVNFGGNTVQYVTASHICWGWGGGDGGRGVLFSYLCLIFANT
jgi:hypothetical protein